MNPNEQAYNQRLHEEAQARVQRVLRLRAAGETWQTIGDLLGITRQRAQQLAAREARRNGCEAA